jgi:D-apionolactonase
MEDQRNWSDASFKTYSGALAVPIPHSFGAGHRVQQAIKIELIGPAPKTDTDAAEPVVLTLPEEPTRTKPLIGTRWAPEAAPLTGEALEEAQELGFHHLLVELNLAESTWKDELTRAQTDARALGAQLLFRLTLTANHAPAFGEFVALTPASSVAGLILLEAGQPCTPSAFIQHVLRDHQAWLGAIPAASAPPLNFADLNRYRPSSETRIAMPLCPQVHTFDHQSIMENLESQPVMIDTIRSFNPHPIWVTPIALLRRRVADARQGTFFAAAYTVGTLAQLATNPQVELLSFYEHTGKNGLLGTPAADVIACLASSSHLAPVVSSAPERVRALALFDVDGTRALMLANLTFEPLTVTLHDGHDDPEDTVTLELGPYAFATIEV